MFSDLIKPRGRRFVEQIPIVLIAVLLICQIIISYFMAYKQSMESQSAKIQQAMQMQIISEESNKLNISTLAATIAADTDVLRILDEVPEEYLYLSETCKRIRKYMTLTQTVSNVYMYSQKNETIFDALANTYKMNGDRIPDIRQGIIAYRQEGTPYFIYKKKNTYQTPVYCQIFEADSKTGDLIIVEENYATMTQDYDKLQSGLKSSLIVAGQTGEVIYGAGEYAFGTDIAGELFFRERTIASPFQMLPYKDSKNLACYTYSEYLRRWYIMLTPEEPVVAGSFKNENYIYTYICIILSLLVLIRVFSLWKKFRIMVLTSRITSSQEKRNDKERARGHLSAGTAEYEAESGIYQDFAGIPQTAVMMVKIDGIEDSRKDYSMTEMELIKYGVDNICREVFERENLKIVQVGETEKTLEYMLGMEADGSFAETFHRAAEACMQALWNYIHMKSSYFLSRSGAVTETVQQGHKLVCELEEYSFVHGKSIILDCSALISASDSAISAAKTLCDKIKEDMIENFAGYQDDMQKLSSACRKMNVVQCHEILYYLVLCLYSAIEQIERKFNLELMFDITKSLMTVESAEYADEIFGVTDALFAEITKQRQVREQSKSTWFVENCLQIIAENYTDEMLCTDEIARRMGFSANYLSRKFKQMTGVSIADKITEVRLAAAAEKLVCTDEKIQQIIKEVGFVNNSYFTVLFRKRFGESPMNYRRNHKG